MPDVAKLKKKAAELELKKQFDKALAVYIEILESFDNSDEDIDVALYNRVGDIYLKQGNVADAVDYYEQAVDRYAESGFFNNAIALCNKILRNSPGRASIYYKLGKISAQKGFVSDAKVNFLEYADRMQKAGKIDEAFRALKEFADLCPDQDDVRLLLADQLSRQERGSEAIEQLQLLYERYTAQGRELEARATVDRMKAIDPEATPRATGRGNDLIFLDLEDRRSRNNSIIAKRATQGLDIIHTGEYQEVEPPAPEPAVADSPAPTPDVLDTPAIEPALLDAVTRAAEFEHPSENAGPLDQVDIGPFQGEPLDAPTEPSSTLLGFEPTDFAGSFAAPVRATPLGLPSHKEPEAGLLDFAMPDADAPAAPLDDLPLLEDASSRGGTPHASSPAIADDLGGDLPLIAPDDESAQSRGDPLADIPLMDFSLPTPGEAMAGIPGSPASEGSTIDFLELDEDSLAQASSGSTAESDAEVDLPITAEEPLAGIPTPPAARPSSTIEAGHSVELLRARVEATPDDHAQRRQLAEAMLESGDREGGLRELEVAMVGFERGDALEAAASVADEIVRLAPESIRHHQKRVEYAFRTNERGRLIEAYLALADTLFRAGQLEKSRAIYHRVIELAPDDIRAHSALDNFAETEPEPTPARQHPTVSDASPRMPAAPRPSRPMPVPDDQFVNLGDWLRDDDAPKDTRMVVDEKEPTGDEEADFQDMLRKFKQGIADNVEEEDHQSHYDLGVAYKEMGLLDEAIAEFQKALRAPSNRVPTYEALGQCFMEKDQVSMAATILGRALHEKGVSEDQLVGVLYLLGRCAEVRGHRDQAVDYYQRVFVIDIQFRDVGERLAAVEGARS